MEMSDENVYKHSDPLVVSSLDLQTVQNYNFPRIPQKFVIEELKKDGVPESKHGEMMTAKGIELGHNGVARPNVVVPTTPTGGKSAPKMKGPSDLNNNSETEGD